MILIRFRVVVLPKGKEEKLEKQGERAKGWERILMDRNKRQKEAEVG